MRDKFLTITTLIIDYDFEFFRYRNVFEEYYFFFYNGKHDIMTETGNENYCSKQSFECQEDDGYTEMFESASGSLVRNALTLLKKLE